MRHAIHFLTLCLKISQDSRSIDLEKEDQSRNSIVAVGCSVSVRRALR